MSNFENALYHRKMRFKKKKKAKARERKCLKGRVGMGYYPNQAY